MRLESLMRVGVLTISDRVSRGEMQDRAGAAIVAALTEVQPEAQFTTDTVPDEHDAIVTVLKRWCDEDRLEAVITTGGTGLGPRDVTPEATLEVISRRIPGIEEALRADGRTKLPAAMLSRGIVGARGQTLIANLPGSPNGAREGTELLSKVLGHAVDLLHGNTRH